MASNMAPMVSRVVPSESRTTAPAMPHMASRAPRGALRRAGRAEADRGRVASQSLHLGPATRDDEARVHAELDRDAHALQRLVEPFLARNPPDIEEPQRLVREGADDGHGVERPAVDAVRDDDDVLARDEFAVGAQLAFRE